MGKHTSHYTSPGELSTILGIDVQLVGEVKAKASLRIDGRIQGNVHTSANITIGADGVVEGDITAQDVVVGGKVIGKLTASGKVILEAKSVLNGDLKTSRLVIEEGAVFIGHSDMGGGGVYQGKTLQLED